MDTGILLESGTNELELLEFKVAGNYYGINVAKIREILPYTKPTPIPNSHPSIEGIIMPRDQVISVINLEYSLGFSSRDKENRDMLVVTEFNQLNTAFHVDAVVGIHRVRWNDIIAPDETINSSVQCGATGIVKIQDKLIIILDFERILEEIVPESSLKTSDIEKLGERTRNEQPILIAEDSHLLRELLKECLTKAGYSNLSIMNNGQEAWDKLLEYKETGKPKECVKCVITDIEMPQMDGHHLIKLIRDDAAFENLPIIVFSSLVNDEMKRKGESLGATEQLSKPEIGELIKVIDNLIGLE